MFKKIDAGVKNDRSVVPQSGWNDDTANSFSNMFPYGGIYSEQQYDRINVGKPIADLKSVGTWGNVLTETAYLRIEYNYYRKDDMCFIARPIQTAPYSTIRATARFVRDGSQIGSPYRLTSAFAILYWNDGSTNIEAKSDYYSLTIPQQTDYSETVNMTLDKSYKWAAVRLVLGASSTASRYWVTYLLLAGTGITGLIAIT